MLDRGEPCGRVRRLTLISSGPDALLVPIQRLDVLQDASCVSRCGALQHSKVWSQGFVVVGSSKKDVHPVMVLSPQLLAGRVNMLTEARLEGLIHLPGWRVIFHHNRPKQHIVPGLP